MAKLPSFRRRDLVVPWRMGDIVFFWWHGGSYLTTLDQSLFYLSFTLILSIGYFVPQALGGKAKRLTAYKDQDDGRCQQSNLFTVL